ncbi:hypothetical protein ANCDUO_25815, partial [Ancylostoma duodenale]
MVKLHLRDNVRDGYTPHTSRSRVKTDLYREFLGSEGDPAMTTVLMLTKDNGSMHRLDYPKAISVEIVDTKMKERRTKNVAVLRRKWRRKLDNISNFRVTLESQDKSIRKEQVAITYR